MFKLDKAFSGLSNARTPFDEATGEFLSVDINAVKADLKLQKRAHDDGTMGVPTDESDAKDALATEIDTYLSDLISRCKDKFLGRIRAMEELTRTQGESTRQTVVKLHEDAMAELKSTVQHRYNDLFTARREWVQGEQEYLNFRDEHNRVGPARYPGTFAKFMGLGIIVLIILFEIGINAYALGSSHPDGPVGVMVEILIFTAINVSAAWFIGGTAWRYFYHKSVFRKIMGLFWTLLGGSVIMFVSFFLAHYRDSISDAARKISLENVDYQKLIDIMLQLGNDAIGSLVATPFMLDDHKSYLLLGFALLAACIVGFDAFKLDDAYPGYGKLQREQKNLGKAYNNKQARYLDEINNLVSEHKRRIQGELARIRAFDTSIQQRRKDHKQLILKYSSWLETTRNVGTALYAYYRQENVKARKDKREPHCFKLHDYILPDGAGVGAPELEDHVSQFPEIEKLVEEATKDLSKRLDENQDRFLGIENLSPDVLQNSSPEKFTFDKEEG